MATGGRQEEKSTSTRERAEQSCHCLLWRACRAHGPAVRHTCTCKHSRHTHTHIAASAHGNPPFPPFLIPLSPDSQSSHVISL